MRLNLHILNRIGYTAYRRCGKIFRTIGSLRQTKKRSERGARFIDWGLGAGPQQGSGVEPVVEVMG